MIATSGFLTALECTKFVFGRGSAPDPAGRTYDASPDPLVGWGGGNPLPIPHPFDAFGILPLDAFGISYPTPSVLASLSPHFQKSGYAAGPTLAAIFSARAPGIERPQTDREMLWQIDLFCAVCYRKESEPEISFCTYLISLCTYGLLIM